MPRQQQQRTILKAHDSDSGQVPFYRTPVSLSPPATEDFSCARNFLPDFQDQTLRRETAPGTTCTTSQHAGELCRHRGGGGGGHQGLSNQPGASVGAGGPGIGEGVPLPPSFPPPTHPILPSKPPRQEVRSTCGVSRVHMPKLVPKGQRRPAMLRAGGRAETLCQSRR